jgi:hypothetical protein
MAKLIDVEYIFDLIINDLDLNLYDDNIESLLKFRTTCAAAMEKAVQMNIFDQKTLFAYDTTLRLFANLLFEKIPADREIDIEPPEWEDFRKWFSQLSPDDFYLILFTLEDQQMMDFKTEEDLQFIINVFFTNSRDAAYDQPNKTDK